MLCSIWYIYVFTLSQTLATLLELILAFRGKLTAIPLLRIHSVGHDPLHSICFV